MAVYFVQDGGPDGHVKIGYTAGNPYSRIATFRTGNPRPLVLLVAIPGGPANERALHEQFKDLRESGEWFRPDARLLGFIDGLRVAFPDQPKDPGPCPDEFTEEQQLFLVGMIRKTAAEDAAASLLERHGLGHPLDEDAPESPDVTVFDSHRGDQRWLDETFSDFAAVNRTLHSVLDCIEAEQADPSLRRGLVSGGGTTPIRALSCWCIEAEGYIERLAIDLYNHMPPVRPDAQDKQHQPEIGAAS